MKSFTKFYSAGVKVLVAIDCIILGFEEDELKLLCFKRLVEPAAGEWSLIGSFVEENESLDNGAKRILKKLTGLDNVYMKQLHAHGDVERDPGARVISVSYFALINIHEHDHQLVRDYSAHWFSLSKLPNLVFDHNLMVQRALNVIRRDARYKPIGFELVPEKFTLPKLQSLYEAIYQKKIDNRNFRKSILNSGVLEKLDEKEKESSKKGAHYYKFNQDNYNTLSERGYFFNVIV